MAVRILIFLVAHLVFIGFALLTQLASANACEAHVRRLDPYEMGLQSGSRSWLALNCQSGTHIDGPKALEPGRWSAQDRQLFVRGYASGMQEAEHQRATLGENAACATNLRP